MRYANFVNRIRTFLSPMMKEQKHIGTQLQSESSIAGSALNEAEKSSQMLRRMDQELAASYEQLKATTDQLYESEQKYKLLIDNMSDLVWIIDLEGNITFINNEIHWILGYQKEEILFSPIYQLMCPLHQYENCSDIISEMKNRDMYRQELWMLHSDGHTRKVIEVNTHRLYSNNQLVAIQGVGRDITAHIKLEQELDKKNKQLAMLYDISSDIASTKLSLSTSEFFDHITKKIVDALNVSLCSIRLLGKDGKLHCMSASGVLRNRITLAPVEVNIAEIKIEIAANKAAYRIKEFVRNNALISFDEKLLDDMVFIPLILNENPIGLLSICFNNGYDEDHVDMLNAIANNMVFAIEKAELYSEIKQYYLNTIRTLVAAIEAKDTYTQGHSIRVSQYAVSIAKELGLSDSEIDEIEMAGILHDIGKIGISDVILTKPGKLEPCEFEQIQLHPEIGCRILEPIGLSEKVLSAALLHHKRFDLQGYPKSVECKELPFIASIISVADAFDAMTSNRSYKLPMTKEEAIKELQRYRGTQFHPDLVDTMKSLFIKNLL